MSVWTLIRVDFGNFRVLGLLMTECQSEASAGAPGFLSDVQEPPGVKDSPASDSKLWKNYLFLTKAPPVGL